MVYLLAHVGSLAIFVVGILGALIGCAFSPTVAVSFLGLSSFGLVLMVVVGMVYDEFNDLLGTG